MNTERTRNPFLTGAVEMEIRAIPVLEATTSEVMVYGTAVVVE